MGRRRDSRVAKCGTDSGYYHHRRALNEDACDACRAAHTAATTARWIAAGRPPKKNAKKPRVMCRVCGKVETVSGRCHACGIAAGYAAQKDKEAEFTGEWVTVGGIRRPVMTRGAA